MNSTKIGILGGGQLGRMLQEAAHRLNLKLTFLDVGPSTPAKQLSNTTHVDGSFNDSNKIKELAKLVDVITFEIEHVDTEILEELHQSGQVKVHPFPETVRIIQDKFVQKTYLKSFGLPLPEFMEVSTVVELLKLTSPDHLGLPIMLKSKTQAYDGRGNFLIRTALEVEVAWKQLNPDGRKQLYVEKYVEFVKELAVMVVRSVNGQVLSYPVVETVHKRNICNLVFAPAQIDGLILKKAQEMAEKAVGCLNGAGIFGVEMFQLKDDSILINEIAPRPHNSGHYTIEACHTSQFENHLRAIIDLPLGSTSMKVPYAAMYNILASQPFSPSTSCLDHSLNATLSPCHAALTIPNATVHLYGKSGLKKDRKMGHITLTSNSYIDLTEKISKILLHSSDPADKITVPEASPIVSIIMGSDSDLPVLKAAAQILTDFNVPFEITIVSAHRTPDRMVEFAKTAHKRGVKCIIAAAGGAAHLPGMVAAMTPLPVIGVPVALKMLDGLDSLYSIVQMPRGVPVATVAINNSTNAALLAVRILGSQSTNGQLMNVYLQKIIEYQEKMQDDVMTKVTDLKNKGWQSY